MKKNTDKPTGIQGKKIRPRNVTAEIMKLREQEDGDDDNIDRRYGGVLKTF